MACKYIYNIYKHPFQSILLIPKGSSAPISNHPIFLPSAAPDNHLPAFCLHGLSTLDFSYKWNHRTDSTWGLFFFFFSFNMFSRGIHSMYQKFIPSYGWIVFPYMHTVYLVYPFYSWQTLGLFLPLTIMTSSTVNICAKVFVWIPVFSALGYTHRSQVGGPYGLTRWRIT